jgi:Zn-dependent protease with chaperone function
VAAFASPNRPLLAAFAQSAIQQTRASQPSPSANAPPADTYQLTPAQRERAVVYSRTRYELYFLGVALSLTIYLFLWISRFGVYLRGRARNISSGPFRQCLIFVPAFLVAAGLLELPFDFFSGFLLDHWFGLSTETWLGWLADWGKSLALGIVAGVFVIWVLYLVVRRKPRSWWFYFWLATIPITLFVIFIQPFVVEPLFYKFTPLERSHPALVGRIEQTLHHAKLSIPPSHIFEMNASSKTRQLDAYVSGFGASKRVVVWDTTLKKMTPDEVLFVVGHETGHYVLHHIVKEFVWIELISLAFLAFGFAAVKSLIGRYGPATGIEGDGDLASLPVMLIALTMLSFLASPAINAVSRHYEHQADQFGLEVTYGVVQDPNRAAVEAFQKLGAEDLSDPSPSAFIRFWLYSHPPLDQRIRFAAHYKPWAAGKPMQLLPSGGKR